MIQDNEWHPAVFGTMALCRPPTQFTKRADPLGANYYE